MSGAGWIGVDLDGTLAHYDTWRGPLHIGDPVSDMMHRVKGWISYGHDVRIFTARVSGKDPSENAAIKQAIGDWCVSHGLPRLRVTCIKDYSMVQLWDDRAVAVEVNTGRPLHEVQDGMGLE